MLRFVDVSEPYWCDKQTAKERPCCVFIDTVTDKCIENDGTHVFDSLEAVEEALGARGVALVPKGFFDRPPVAGRTLPIPGTGLTLHFGEGSFVGEDGKVR